MNQNLPSYQLIDYDNWPRKEHYDYYTNQIKCGYTVTSKLDVTNALHYAKQSGKHFYACMIYAAAAVINQMPELRMMRDGDGRPGYWEASHPVFTTFHKDDNTFSDLWTTFHHDFSLFYQGFEQVMTQYKDVHGIKGRKDQPANFFCISCVPWMDYSGLATYSVEGSALFPILTYGKYTEEAGRYTLPFSMTISHASADGFHTSQFFQLLQQQLKTFI